MFWYHVGVQVMNDTLSPERQSELRQRCEAVLASGTKNIDVEAVTMLALLTTIEPTQDAEVARMIADLQLRSDAGARAGRIQTARAMDNAAALIARLARELAEVKKIKP
jgi:hypothetical protein